MGLLYIKASLLVYKVTHPYSPVCVCGCVHASVRAFVCVCPKIRDLSKTGGILQYSGPVYPND